MLLVLLFKKQISKNSIPFKKEAFEGVMCVFNFDPNFNFDLKCLKTGVEHYRVYVFMDVG